jgi:hypothetical protein
MKALIKGIEFEGTPQEMAQLLISVSDSQKQSFSSASETQSFESAEDFSSELSLENKSGFLPGTEKFLAALFRYRPSNTSMGREAYVVQMLATGKVYTIKQLVRGARTDLLTVKNSVDRAVSAGCIIHVAQTQDQDGSLGGSKFLTMSSKLKMISLGSVEQAMEVKSRHTTEHKRNKKNVSNIIDTGSAPITKIIYAEDKK